MVLRFKKQEWWNSTWTLRYLYSVTPYSVRKVYRQPLWLMIGLTGNWATYYILYDYWRDVVSWRADMAGMPSAKSLLYWKNRKRCTSLRLPLSSVFGSWRLKKFYSLSHEGNRTPPEKWLPCDSSFRVDLLNQRLSLVKDALFRPEQSDPAALHSTSNPSQMGISKWAHAVPSQSRVSPL